MTKNELFIQLQKDIEMLGGRVMVTPIQTPEDPLEIWVPKEYEELAHKLTTEYRAKVS